jgi:hypothetical protein
MSLTMRRVALLLFLLVLWGAGPAAAAGLPRVLTQLKPAFQVRPAVISYTGDGTGLVGGFDGSGVKHPGHLQWTTYNRLEGLGRGLLWLDDCTPSCAGGTFTSTPVSVHAFDPRSGRFQRLTLTYTYDGKAYTDRRGIRYYAGVANGPGYWQYDIISF